MRILVLNCGGSSLKYRLFNMAGPSRRDAAVALADGEVAGIGQPTSSIRQRAKRRNGVEGRGGGHQENGGRENGGYREYRDQREMLDHKHAIDLALRLLIDPLYGAVSSLSEIDVVGHRVVHAGTRYTGSVRVTADVIDALRESIELAPLHNPPNLAGIEACQALMPETPQIAVFDNTLHSTVPPYAYIYGLPYEYYERYGVRRYGFHGITFAYMSETAAAFLGRSLFELKLVLLMLGSGWTACAMDRGRSVDVSTGFTPTEGLVQSTRCGDVDPLAITYLMKKENLTSQMMDDILNRKSGWLGISGVSADLREVEKAAEGGNQRAQLALEAIAYRARKYVGAYAAAMGGVDAVVFSGGIGEKSIVMRRSITAGLEFLGLKVDSARNEAVDASASREPTEISSPDSRVRCVVVPTDEEWMIAREAYSLASKAKE